jgi:hypothetical protein
MQEIDIAVHCDVNIFQWLMRYMQDDPKATINLKNVLPILISAEFLQIAKLVTLCLEFMSKFLNDVVHLPIDMNCLNVVLQRRLSVLVNIDQLVNLKDKKDKLKSRLFMRKCEDLVFVKTSNSEQEEFENNKRPKGIFSLKKCKHCLKLFTLE